MNTRGLMPLSAFGQTLPPQLQLGAQLLTMDFVLGSHRAFGSQLMTSFTASVVRLPEAPVWVPMSSPIVLSVLLAQPSIAFTTPVSPVPVSIFPNPDGLP